MGAVLMQSKLSAGAVVQLQALAQAVESVAHATAGGLSGFSQSARIDHLEPQLITALLEFNLQLQRGAAAGLAELEGVLHQRLQQKARHRNTEQLRIHVDAALQLLAEKGGCMAASKTLESLQ
jgi:hypothetical protein